MAGPGERRLQVEPADLRHVQVDHARSRAASASRWVEEIGGRRVGLDGKAAGTQQPGHRSQKRSVVVDDMDSGFAHARFEPIDRVRDRWGWLAFDSTPRSLRLAGLGRRVRAGGASGRDRQR